jgi:hypothetical protein
MPLTPEGRVSFPEVYTPTAMNETAKKKYSVTLLFDLAELQKDPKQYEKLVAMKAAAEAACKEKFGVSLNEPYRGKNLQSPFRKSEEKPEYMPAGHIFVRLSTQKKPGVVDAGKQAISEESGNFYAGCYAHASYTVYAYDESGNRGVAFGLSNIQKVRDGEAIGGKSTTPDEDFEELATTTTANNDIPF